MDREHTRVLIVDDDEHIRVTFEKYLKDMGWDVESVSDTADAKRILEAKEFDVAIIDNALPGGESGMDLVMHLSNVQSTCLAILISGYTLFESLEERYDCDIFAILYKPIKLVELNRIVKAAATQARLRASS